MAPTAVELTGDGLALDGAVLPLWSGSMHYWRIDPKLWPRCLDEVLRLGLEMVCTYVPWAEHEVEAGRYDFGEFQPRRNLHYFLDLCEERGLKVLLRPGPHINAELTFFGFPDRILRDPRCLAQSARGTTVWLPAPPRFFPVPSFASSVFLEEVQRWLRGFADAVRDRLATRGGPVVALQADNEAALFFRTAPFDQDYAPDALSLWRRWLAQRYGDDIYALNEAHGSAWPSFAAIRPPTRFDVVDRRVLARQLDWIAFKEWTIENFVGEVASTLREAGLRGVPIYHNFAMTDGAPPHNLAGMERTVDLVGIDLYHPRSQLHLVRESVLKLVGTSRLPFIPELGIGAPWYMPALSVADCRTLLLASLAYGARAFNLYMLVERDRWYGSPISARGKPRDHIARFYERVHGALARLEFHRMRRLRAAALLTDRAMARLAVASSPWDPLPGGLLRLLGLEADGMAGEAQWGYGRPVAVDAARAAGVLKSALSAAAIPHLFADTNVEADRLQGVHLYAIAAAGFLSEEAQRLVLAQLEAGDTVVIGPEVPKEFEAGRAGPLLHDAVRSTQRVDAPLPHLVHRVGRGRLIEVPGLHEAPPDAVASLLDGLATQLGLPREPRIEAGARVDASWHVHPDGHRVIGLVNRSERAVAAAGELEDLQLRDLASGERFDHRSVPLAPGSARLLEVLS
ncbi:MAG: hypothetical protein D6729_00745 [Deltaproteobacteria bacterium]|nr:MAG: hypothetical protein D6729_00745 [Deltaproteobacteria bacterium]